MQIALTGGTGFLGRYIVANQAANGDTLRVWHRPGSDRSGLESYGPQLTWVEGSLADPASAAALVTGCDAVVHAALDRPGGGFRGAEGDIVEFAQRNIIGTLILIEAARQAGAARFIFVSTCAVHEQILDDRPLDEAHPLWPFSHYGAYKAAVEKFVHSYGLGGGDQICALRPTGIYGLEHLPQNSKWYELVRAVAAGESVECQKGGKEVHAADVASAVGILLQADNIAGQSYNCYDRYVSEYEVAQLAKQISGSGSTISGKQTQPKHQIETGKLRALGMEFGGEALLRQTVEQLVAAVGL